MDPNLTYRTLLNTYCQKNSLLYPKFNTQKISGEAHKPVFQCKIIFEYKSYISNLLATKAECEEDIAKQIYEELNKEDENNDENIKTYKNFRDFLGFLIQEKKSKSTLKLMMIDLENISNIDWENVKKYANSHTIVIVKGKGSNLKFQRNDIELCMVIAEIYDKDAADTLMILIVGASFTFVDEYVIISRDHFATTLKKIMSLEGVNFTTLPSI